jgi:hypothetical protein
MPRTLVTKHQRVGIGGRELQVIQPVGGAVDDGLLAGAGVDGEHRHRDACLLALQQTHFLGLGERERLAVLASSRIVGVEPRIPRALLELIGPFGIHA